MKLAASAARLANGILVMGGVLSLSALCYFFYYYSWTGSRQFTRAWGPYLYYAAPAVAAILLFAALTLKRRQRINVALFLWSTFCSLYLAEFLATLWFARPTVQLQEIRAALADAAHANRISFDTRSKSDVVHDLRAQKIEAVPSLYPRGLIRERGDGTVAPLIVKDGAELLPLGSVSDTTTVVCNENGEYLIYSADQHGFNNPGAVWQQKKVDVVAVGDSFTQGWCVDQNHNFVNQVRKKHAGILNLGIENNGPLIELATLREYGEALRPRIVLWFFYEGNDLRDLAFERRSSLLNGYRSRGFSQGLINRQSEIDSALKAFVDQFMDRNRLWVGLEEEWEIVTNPGYWGSGISGIVKLSTLRQRLGLVAGEAAMLSEKEIAGTAGGSQTESMEPVLEDLYAILSSARTTVDEWGGELYFIYLPERQRYIHGGHPLAYRDRVLDTAMAAGLRVIDMHPIFKAQKDPVAFFPFGIAGHYNDRGHFLVADEVLRSVFRSPGASD